MTTRIISLLLAILFFISTVGFSVYVILEARNEDEAAQEQAALQEAINNASQDANDQQTQEGDEDMLAGTKLEGFEPISEQVTELQIIDLVEGEGEVVEEGANVTVHYTGALVSDGTIFESSLDRGEPITFGLEGLIVGWQEGIPGMKVGGKRRLIIPAEKAYGDQSTGSIPANSDLVFDIELLGITE